MAKREGKKSSKWGRLPEIRICFGYKLLYSVQPTLDFKYKGSEKSKVSLER